MAIRGITYEEPLPDTYKNVDISYDKIGEPSVRIFNTGNFVKDWYDLVKWIIFAELQEPLCNSSSVDHFIMDGAPYDSAVLKFKSDDTPYLDYAHDYLLGGDNGIEFFVEKNTEPTWEELKKLCDDSN